MKRIFLYLGLLTLAAPSLFVVPAQAQATRTWISGVGDDVNTCSRTSPCKTFPGAIAQTGAGGEIDTLDPGGFGAVTVTKAITLANEGIGEAGILVAGTNGVTVNCVSDPQCVVVLRGLVIDGGPIGSNSLNGVRFVQGRALQVENCVIRNFTGGSPNGYGISFEPTTAAKLEVSDSVIATSGQLGGGSNIGGGIFVQPATAAGATVLLQHVQLLNNTNGLRIDNTVALAPTYVSVQDSVVDGSGAQGIAVVTVGGNPKATLVLNRDTISNNTVDGVVSNGPASAIFMGNSTVTGNLSHGLIVTSGGVITSYQNNEIDGNKNDNTAALTLGTMH